MHEPNNDFPPAAAGQAEDRKERNEAREPLAHEDEYVRSAEDAADDAIQATSG